MSGPIRLRSRPNVATLLVGTVVGMLLAGLLVPLAFGKTATKVNTGASSGARVGGTTGSGVDESARGTTTGAVTVTTLPGGALPGPSAGGTAGPEAGAAPVNTPTTGSGATDPLTATDVGVTSTTIKVGFMLLDLGQLGRNGFNQAGVDPKQQQQALQIYVDDINNRGGISGRKIQPFYRVFDAFSPDDLRAACLEMTEDKKVFTVVAMPGYGGPPVLCVTAEHHTPLVGTGDVTSQDYFDKSGGLLITQMMTGERYMANYVDQLDAINQLAGRKIGILTDDSDVHGHVVNGSLIPNLQKAGHNIAYVARLSADTGTASSQIPVEVANMRAKGVDTVIIVEGFVTATQFVQQAGAQGWNPRWLSSDWGGASDNENQEMPPSFDGALVMTSKRYDEVRAGLPENPADARCREMYEKGSGQQLEHTGNGSDAAYQVVVIACGLVQIFAAGAKAAGPVLTRGSLSSAIQNLGQIDDAFTLPGRFRTGKTDFNDSFRWLRYSAQCRCLNIVEPTIRGARFA